MSNTLETISVVVIVLLVLLLLAFLIWALVLYFERQSGKVTNLRVDFDSQTDEYVVTWQPPSSNGNGNTPLSYPFTVALAASPSQILQQGNVSTTSFLMRPNNTYPIPGEPYIVSVSAQNQYGTSAPATLTVIPQNAPPVVQSLVFDDTQIDQGQLFSSVQVYSTSPGLTGNSLNTSLSGIGANDSTIQGICALNGRAANDIYSYNCEYDWSKSNPGWVPAVGAILSSSSFAVDPSGQKGPTFQQNYTAKGIKPTSPLQLQVSNTTH